MNLVTIFQTFNDTEAHVVRSRLEAAGIEATVTHEVGSMNVDVSGSRAGGVLVQVADTQAAEARALIEASETSGDET